VKSECCVSGWLEVSSIADLIPDVNSRSVAHQISKSSLPYLFLTPKY
jgi:hypothetical protein